MYDAVVSHERCKIKRDANIEVVYTTLPSPLCSYLRCTNVLFGPFSDFFERSRECLAQFRHHLIFIPIRWRLDVDSVSVTPLAGTPLAWGGMRFEIHDLI